MLALMVWFCLCLLVHLIVGGVGFGLVGVSSVGLGVFCLVVRSLLVVVVVLVV